VQADDGSIDGVHRGQNFPNEFGAIAAAGGRYCALSTNSTNLEAMLELLGQLQNSLASRYSSNVLKFEDG
jgi:hypothetical protein